MGNTSIKIYGSLFIKASGKCLSDAQSDDFFVAVDLGRAKQSDSRVNCRASATLGAISLVIHS
jgi:rhamnose utilization protein RhaD (predicted bifunctional aldolase and dehydrogenase)